MGDSIDTVLKYVLIVVVAAPTIVRVLVLLAMRKYGVPFEPKAFSRGVRFHLLLALLWPGLPIAFYFIFGGSGGMSGVPLVLLAIPVLLLYHRADRHIAQARAEGRKGRSSNGSAA